MDQISPVNQDHVDNQQIQLMDGMLGNATLMAAESHIIAVMDMNWSESKRLTAKLMAHGLQRSFPFAFVSIVKSQVT
jgi:hypothetical protein